MAFDFTKPANGDWENVYARHIYLRQVYLAVKEGYRPKDDAMSYFANDIRLIDNEKTFFYDDDYSKDAFLDDVYGIMSFTGKCGQKRDIPGLLADWNYSFGSNFGEASNAHSKAQGAKIFGDYLYDVRMDLDEDSRNELYYAGVLLYRTAKGNPNPYLSVEGVTAVNKTPAQIFEDAADLYQETFVSSDGTIKPTEEGFWSSVSAISVDEHPISGVVKIFDTKFTDMLSTVRQKEDESSVVKSGPVVPKAFRGQSVRKGDFSLGSSAYEDWSPNKGDNGFDFDEPDDDKEYS